MLMRILALDTTTHIASVALTDGSAVRAEITLDVTNQHTAQLIPLIHQILTATHTELKAIDGIAVGIGPGLFTGVRIGVGTAKSLAYALDKPIVGICTLDIVAFNLRGAERPVCAMLDARRNEVYAAIYSPPSHRCSEVMCVSVEQLSAAIQEPCLLVGTGTQAYRDQIERFLGDRGIFVEPAFALPRASLLAQLALPRFARGDTDDAMALTPLYVRRPEAEMQYESGRLGKKTLIETAGHETSNRG